MNNSVCTLHISILGKRIIVTGLDVRDSDSLVPKKVVKCTDLVYDKLKELDNYITLGLGYVNLSPNCINKSEIQLQDLIINKEVLSDDNLIPFIKKSYLIRGKDVLNSRLKNDNIENDFYEYFLNKEYLEYRGYIFREDNDTELISKILNTKDSELIDRMQEFLNIRSALDKKQFWYKLFLQFKKDVEKCSTEKEIKHKYDEYCEHFF